ncbi:MAG TPA: hypothetical protein VD884_10105 [Ohtaekwangia sp.]|nr:hypothetical protein [Ohtaekwangia sp.]
MRRYRLIIPMLVISSTLSFGQTPQYNEGFMDGYIVKVNNDTLYGQVKLVTEGSKQLRKIRLRNNKDSNVDSYNSKEIKGFQLGRFTYRVLDNRYFKEISNGKRIDVLERQVLTYSSTPMVQHTTQTGFNPPSTFTTFEEKFRMQLVKNDGTSLKYVNDGKLIKKKLKAQLIEFFKDEPNLVSKITKGFYTTNDILYMAYEYDNSAKWKLKLIDEAQYKKEKAEKKKERREMNPFSF